jgi:hypothetical protein
MEDKLRAIVTKIEQSNLLESDKNHLYGMISLGLQETVEPVLLKYVPKDTLMTMTSGIYKFTVESYVDLISDAVKDGKALNEIDQTMQEMLAVVDKALQEEGI